MKFTKINFTAGAQPLALPLAAKGRNGMLTQTGVQVTHYENTGMFEINPLTTRGVSDACFLTVTAENAGEVCAALSPVVYLGVLLLPDQINPVLLVDFDCEALKIRVVDKAAALSASYAYVIGFIEDLVVFNQDIL